MGTHHISYQHQIDHLRKYPEDRCETMLNHNTINRWRYERMYNCIDPVLRMFPKSEWLTVGDFYYGTDAQYLQSKGHKTVASDIDDYFLKKGKEMGYIENYSRENVESLSFKDESFDFVLCKETFHHLPRPYLGLYEMLRVSKIGIILIEPYDRLMNASFIEKICMWILKKIKGNMEELYEPSGNYKYSISLREIEKIALGLNIPHIAFKYLNDYYRDGLGIEFKEKDDKLLRKIKNQILLRDILWKLRFFPPTFIVSLIFKAEVNPDFLVNEGYEVIRLTDNPYMVEKKIG